mgnify:CR=1 FL=1
MNFFTPENLPLLTVGTFLVLCTVGWAIKTLFTELFCK